MKLLLKEDVPNLGLCGDEVEVKDGYGRNYLLPQGKALFATPENLKAFKHQKNVVQAKVRKLKKSAEELCDKINSVTCEFVKKVGDQGKLFGSVTSQEITQYLKEKGLNIDRRKIQLSEPIKTLGDHTVEYKIHKEVTAKISVKVIQDKNEGLSSSSKEEEKAINPETLGETTREGNG